MRVRRPGVSVLRGRKLAVLALIVISSSACSVPKAETLNCGEEQSIFACQAKFSDGKSRSIVFVKVPAPGQQVLDEVTTKDDLGNEYCVTLYQNVTATYVPGTCGAPIAGAGVSAEPTATTLDPNAVPQGVACEEGTPVLQCRAAFSDGTIRTLAFVESPSADMSRVDSDPHVDDEGVTYCVTLYAEEDEAKATYVVGTEGC
ncbi:MAG: hypothetical protein RIS39_1248 [Actinomycetota bacterium]